MIRSARIDRRGPRRQRGIVATYIAIVVLVVSLLAAVALMRSVDASNTIAGSLTFRQGVFQEADRAYADALQQLTTMSGTALQTDQSTGNPSGQVFYYAEAQALNSQGIPTVLAQASPVSKLLPATSTGNQVYYVIERMCPTAGPPSKLTCIVPSAAITGGSSANANSDPGVPFNTTGTNAAFRLSVMVRGPKNTVAYVQTILR